MSLFYLIDGSSYIYRAFYAIRDLATSTGIPTNAVLGFTNMLLKVVREKHPDSLALIFDPKGPTRRHKEFAAYKAQRPAMPDPMSRQIPYIHRAVEAFSIPMIVEEGHEADDLIATLATKAAAQGEEVVIVTGDKDLLQLIRGTPGEPGSIVCYDTMKEKVFTEAEVRERFGVGPDRVVEVMGLMGDAVDNIPGVPGVGEKTATALIQEFGSVEGLLANLPKISKPKLREALAAHAEQARFSRELAILYTDCPIEFDRERFAVRSPDFSAVVALCRELEFASLLKVLSPSVTVEGGERVTILSDRRSVEAFLEKAAQASELAVEILTTQERMTRAQMIGIAMAIEGETVYLGPELLPALCDLFSNSAIKKFAHDLKNPILLLHRSGNKLAGGEFDTMIASYLLNPSRRDHTLEAVVLEEFGHRLALPSDILPEKNGSFSFVSAQTAGLYAGERARTILRLARHLEKRLREHQMENLFRDIEMPLIEVLAAMEEAGFLVDADRLREMGKELSAMIADCQEKIYRIAGERFNIGSPVQLRRILFEKLGLKPIKRTKTGYSTDEDVLTQLAAQHDLPAEIISCRQLAKLKNTYIDAFPALLDPQDGRLHTQFVQTMTATGRLSSRDPNLQNIPIRGDIGRRIREAFIAPRGCLLLSADYNQIELRLLAHMSQDERLLEAFQAGEDIHMQTAVKIFNLPKGSITHDMRRAAKTVNFGILYGISPFGLSQSLGVSQHEAKRYIDGYFESYSGVKRFIEKTLEEAKSKGYVWTLFGRRRAIPELSSSSAVTRSAGERLAVNTPIQGSAADIIKMAMIKIHRRLAGGAAKMILQVHDELIFEAPQGEIDKIRGIAAAEMGGVAKLAVPLTVDIGVGRNWAEAKG